MSIPIKKESADMYRNTRVYECCYFCNLETDMWHVKSNTPVCPHCSESRSVEELPGAKLLVRPEIKEEQESLFTGGGEG